MPTLYTALSQNIIETPEYAKAVNVLFDAYIKKTAGEPFELPIDTQQKLSTSSQYFYQSDNQAHVNEGANLLSMLLFVAGEDTAELIPIAKQVYSDSGDFPNLKLLENKFQQVKFKLSVFSKTQNELRQTLNTIEAVSHPLTDYQRNLWEDLKNDEDVITVAPTSTGKTHIILQYIVEEVASAYEAFAAIVVPTRALISEVANNLYEIAKSKGYENNIEICTVPKDGTFNDKTIFVMTQERLFELLQGQAISFDYLFIDEAHNISDKSRGVLLHLTLQHVLEDSSPQIIISMPSEQYQNAFESVFSDVNFSRQIVAHSPVAKVFISTKLKGRNIELSKLGSDSLCVIPKNFTGSKLADLAYRLGQGESNIVYRNKTNECEDVARDIAKNIPEEVNSTRLFEAADYVEKFLHEDFSLADNLRRGVAFHYGPLPGVIRRMIEDLAREGEVKFIACTSTLAEGVNLPAKNLFLINPMQIVPYSAPDRLEDVRLDNITGRAGRMLEHLSGNIFLIDQTEWTFKDYFDDIKKEEKIPIFFNVLNEDIENVINALTGTFDSQEEGQYTLYTIANKLVREYGNETLSTTLNAPELSLPANKQASLVASIKAAYENLKVSTFTLEANPTIGYIQQNRLYQFLSSQRNIDDWVLPHPMSADLYPRLLTICNTLKDQGIFFPTHSSSEFISSLAKKWIQGKPLRTIINDQIVYDSGKERIPSCNKSVRDVIKTVNTDIRFKFAAALRCYHLILTEVLSKMKSDTISVKLHTFIEIGGCSERIINLVNMGLAREAAIEIHNILPDRIRISSFEELKKLFESNKLEQLHAVTQKELVKLFS
ncbi:DEAD/DEAH box helicase [Halodesulfovibrio spirochaetisodalis]|uniref:RNA helicase n=1 Tax=Halodesulfovibrio spirochaetisodalis TaxID=1560234 RepID=A0A1B7XA22_9BACT|nr:DEAD/DEAH box helicase [Halodesulfovibrio spirochaetisodalis]OBQ46221.1 RNA helicase [Halodesulfovibrio spirochaetisodalis]